MKPKDTAYQFYDESGDPGMSIIITYTQKKSLPEETASNQVTL